MKMTHIPLSIGNGTHENGPGQIFLCVCNVLRSKGSFNNGLNETWGLISQVIAWDKGAVRSCTSYFLAPSQNRKTDRRWVKVLMWGAKERHAY